MCIVCSYLTLCNNNYKQMLDNTSDEKNLYNYVYRKFHAIEIGNVLTAFLHVIPKNKK